MDYKRIPLNNLSKVSDVKKKSGLIALTLVVILLASFYQIRVGSIDERAKQVLQKVQEIEGEVQEIRNLTFKEQPKIIVITRQEALKKWGPSKGDIYELRMWEAIYKMTFLVPPSYNLTKEKKEQTASWIAATMGNKVYIIEENFLESGETAYRVVAHELTHVLQKQNFNAPYSGPTLDSTLAIRALVEGDADLVADLYCKRHHILIEKITSLYLENPVWSLNAFPYVFGDKFVQYLYEKGGWGLVNGAYLKLPVTTQQVMNPEMYLSYTLPENVSLSVRNGEVIHEDTMGEFYVYLLLLVHNYEEKEAKKIADGWRGDKLILSQNSTSLILIWKTAWKDDISAEKFYSALKKIGNNYIRAHPEFELSFTIKQEGRYVIFTAVRRLKNA
nr:DUF4157 domain-containing protein [Thermococcus sp. M39]